LRLSVLLEAGAAHSEQVVRVSGRTLGPPLARFALHCLQCFGSFLNCLSWKKNCSPAVNTNSAPQSMHFKTLSLKSMADFPQSRENTEIGYESKRLAGPVSLSSCVNPQPGPGPQ
jgi:hypothetical protein